MVHYFSLLLLFICLPVGVCGSSTPDAVEIPFTLQKGAVLIQVTLKGKGPFNMAIATGAPRSSIAWAARDAIEYPLLWTIEPLTQKQIMYVHASDMQIGKLKIDTLSMRLMEMDSFSQEFGVPLHGVLGYDFLRGRVIRIDYRNKLLTFLPKNTNAKNQSTPPTNPPLAIMPIDINPDDPRPVINDVLINGVKLKVMLDTWQNLPLSLTPQAIKQIGLPTSPEKTPLRIGTIEMIQLAGVKLNSIETAFYAKGTGLDHGMNKYGGILGGGFFRNYCVTFDLAKKLLIIE